MAIPELPFSCVEQARKDGAVKRRGIADVDNVTGTCRLHALDNSTFKGCDGLELMPIRPRGFGVINVKTEEVIAIVKIGVNVKFKLRQFTG
ncbi:hypothetical protein SUGI_1035310 [Cryptomeria japonica]|nr:hypothetical protein SUGI_1035310 [Cryptomeria japonica]